MKFVPTESRRHQILYGSLVIGAVGLFLVLLWFGRHLPGAVGEWFGLIVGISTSPFLMPVFFILLGFFVVNTLNSWRRHREGDDCVYLETAEGPGSEDLPKQARTVIYDGVPLPAESPDVISQLEGSLAIADYETATELLTEMEDDLRDSPQVIRLRIELAVATGKLELADRLRARLSGH
jgi:hypothetical protein